MHDEQPAYYKRVAAGQHPEQRENFLFGVMLLGLSVVQGPASEPDRKDDAVVLYPSTALIDHLVACIMIIHELVRSGWRNNGCSRSGL